MIFFTVPFLRELCFYFVLRFSLPGQVAFYGFTAFLFRYVSVFDETSASFLRGSRFLILFAAPAFAGGWFQF
jgi:hypothetical protein